MTRFAYALCYLIHEHHDLEETLLFPLIEQAAGVPDLMETNVVQHSEFTPGFHAFYTYVNQMINGVAVWDAKKFVGQIESFAPVLTLHLTDEIKTLLELAKYDVDWAGIMKRVQEHGIAHVEKVSYHSQKNVGLRSSEPQLTNRRTTPSLYSCIAWI